MLIESQCLIATREETENFRFFVFPNVLKTQTVQTKIATV